MNHKTTCSTSRTHIKRKRRITMARQNAKIMNDVVTFTKSDERQFKRCVQAIADAQEQAEGLAQTIAGNLYIVAQKKLYQLEDYSTVHEWAMDTFGIAKGTVSDAINTFARFGDGVTGRLQDKYSAYNYSTLMKLKKYSDEELERMEINPEMSRSQVMKAIEAYKERVALADKLPKLSEEWTKTYAEFASIIAEPEDRVNHILEIVPKYMDKDYSPTADDYERLIELTRAFIDGATEDVENPFTGEDEVSEEEQFTEPMIPASEQEETEEEEDNSEEECGSYPTATLNIAEYIENGKFNEKMFNKAIKALVQDIIDHKYDLLITNIEK